MSKFESKYTNHCCRNCKWINDFVVCCSDPPQATCTVFNKTVSLNRTVCLDDEVYVGDEIEFNFSTAVITRINNKTDRVYVMYGDGSCESCELSEIMLRKKTGRHFDEVETLLNKLMECDDESTF